MCTVRVPVDKKPQGMHHDKLSELKNQIKIT